MKRQPVKILITLLTIIISLGCGGAPKKEVKTVEPPKPPVDENLLDLAPYETDVVLWIDLKKVRQSQVWSLIQSFFDSSGVRLPEEEAIKNPLINCDEIVLAFSDSEQNGNQLLVLVKGTKSSIGNVLASFDQNQKAEALKVESYDARRTPKLFLLSFTERTIAFGNEGIVRMSAKTSVEKSRPLKVNPKFKDFFSDANVAAKLRYRSGVMMPLLRGVKEVVPRLNPDAITGVDGTVKVDDGLAAEFHIQTETQMEASLILRELEKAKSRLDKNMFVLLLGVGWMLDRFQLSSEKNIVKINLKLNTQDLQEVKQLLDRLQKIRELLNNMDQKAPLAGGGEE